MGRNWEACSTNHENSVEDKAIHELKLKQLHDSQVSGDDSQSEWLILQQPDFGDLLATVKIDRKSEFRIEFDLHNDG